MYKSSTYSLMAYYQARTSCCLFKQVLFRDSCPYYVNISHLVPPGSTPYPTQQCDENNLARQESILFTPVLALRSLLAAACELVNEYSLDGRNESETPSAFRAQRNCRGS